MSKFRRVTRITNARAPIAYMLPRNLIWEKFVHWMKISLGMKIFSLENNIDAIFRKV